PSNPQPPKAKAGYTPRFPEKESESPESVAAQGEGIRIFHPPSPQPGFSPGSGHGAGALREHQVSRPCACADSFGRASPPLTPEAACVCDGRSDALLSNPPGPSVLSASA